MHDANYTIECTQSAYLDVVYASSRLLVLFQDIAAFITLSIQLKKELIISWQKKGFNCYHLLYFVLDSNFTTLDIFYRVGAANF